MLADGEPIDLAALDDLAVGAWILGTGGGGDPYHGLLNIRRLYDEGRCVRLIGAEDLADDDLVAVVSQMGAPLVSQERITDPAMITAAARLMEDYIGQKFAAAMSLEIGGGNAIQPLLAAALMDIPVVDGDGMGRAFPAVFHTSFAVGGLASAPFSLWDIRGNGMVITEAEDWTWVERISRRVCMEMGARAFTCKAPRTGREVKDWGVLGTVSQAIRIGRTVQAARRAHADPIGALLAKEGGRRLFEGKVLDVERRMTGGYLRGHARFEGLGPDRDSSFAVDFQNEFLVGWRDEVAVVTVPDLICVLDSVAGGAVGTEALRYGQRITVIALPAPAVFLTPRGLDHAGPKAFGYDLPFRSLFPESEVSHKP
jgi:uncharacterized protein